MSLSPVPKPTYAGEGKTALVSVAATYVNVRTGPGTDYTDIGDLRGSTYALYYPASNTSGWVWVEQNGTAGWVALSVTDFDEVEQYSAGDYPPTPYDGKSALWHWKGQAVPENTIEELAKNVNRNSPNVKQFWVKVGDGNAWQGEFDSGDMAVNGSDDIDRWVQTLGKYGLEFHAWVVLHGVDTAGEADLIIEACQCPGVKSIILDVEPYEGYWKAGRDPIRPLMMKIREGVGNDFHIGLGVDPRKMHYDGIYPEEWLPFVNSVHMMCYWTTFRRDPTYVLEEAFATWGGYGRPLIPILQGVATVEEQREAQFVATQRFKAKAVSWWYYGVIGQWSAIDTPISVDETPTEPTEEAPVGTQFGKEKIVFAGKDDHRRGSYTGNEEFIKFTGAMGWEAYYTASAPTTSNVWSEWKTELPEDGIYQISVFIPARHSTTTKARYKVHGIRGTNTEVVVDLNQSIYRNLWVPLGIFDLVKDQTNAGKVFLNDVTGESDKQVAFDAVRFRQIVAVTEDTQIEIADGIDSPVDDSRAGSGVWPSSWYDATGFAEETPSGYVSKYGYHTGADLNLTSGGNSDQGEAVYSVASGIVTYQASLRPWGNLTVIRHDPLKAATGKTYYSRYGHMQNVVVNVGDRVTRGQKIGEVGTGEGRFIAHLHFDISPTNVLESSPGDWPNKDLTGLKRNYVNPKDFTKSNRP